MSKKNQPVAMFDPCNTIRKWRKIIEKKRKMVEDCGRWGKIEEDSEEDTEEDVEEDSGR